MGWLDELRGSEKNVSRFRKIEVSLLLSVRLIPVVRFFAANVLVSISQVSFRNFVLITGIGILPGSNVFTSLRVGLDFCLIRGLRSTYLCFELCCRHGPS